jgi:autotransporter-associated beta strand protein
MYWDINGATAGSGGAYPSGTWSTTATNWTLDATGASMTTVWSNGNSAVFSAGTDQTGTAKTFIVTASSGILVSNITQQQGLVRLSGAALTPVGTSMNITATNNNANDYDLRIDQTIADSGYGTTVTKNGPGVLLLESASSFTGGFTLNGGTVGMETGGSVFGTGTLTLQSGNIEKSWGSSSSASQTVTNAVNVTGTVNAAVVQGNAGNLVFSGPITGNGFLAVSNVNLGGGLTIQNSSVVIAGDVSSFNGTFYHNTVSSGNGNAMRFGSGSGAIVVNASNAKFMTAGSTSYNSPVALADANYGTFRMGELSGSGGHIRAAWNTSGNTTFEIGALNTSTTFAGNIDDNINGAGGRANVTKVGTGTLTLSGPCSYTGLTTISNGVLQINAAFLSTNNAVVIASPGVLGLSYSGVDQVKSLTIDGATMPNGTYGASGSGAANIDNAHFAGFIREV